VNHGVTIKDLHDRQSRNNMAFTYNVFALVAVLKFEISMTFSCSVAEVEMFICLQSSDTVQCGFSSGLVLIEVERRLV
jgi:hypothetical protein